MIIKSFTAESASAALKKVREAMGGEALVLKIRQNPEAPPDSRLEITALLDRHSVAETSTILADAKPKRRLVVPSPAKNRVPKTTVADGAKSFQLTQTPKVEQVRKPVMAPVTTPGDERLIEIERKLSQLLQYNAVNGDDAHRELYRKLIDADLTEDYVQELFDRALENTERNAKLDVTLRDLLTADLSEAVVEGLEFKPGDRVLFVGPTASGKTAALGKLAASLSRNGAHKVLLGTIDNFKIGAHDEIQSYAELLDLNVIDPLRTDPTDEIASEAVSLIDTPAVPSSEEKFRELRNKIDALQPTHCFAVFSALTRSSDIRNFQKRLADLGATHLIITMLDQTGRRGSLITAGRSTGLPVTYVTDTPGGLGTLKIMEATDLLHQILDYEVAQ